MSGTSKTSTSPLDGDHPEEQDYLRYFRNYSYISHQRSMLEDHKRTGAYFRAMLDNPEQFKDKVVLDVGTGSGILAMFAAKAGAKKVYAVEATSMALNARKLVEANHLQDVITVIQGTIESVVLPEKVDIIVSEWMGYLLLRETMLDSVLIARDRFLKPGGALYPSHARMYWAPMKAPGAAASNDEYEKTMENWEWFLIDMKSYYGIDMEVLSTDYQREQKAYHLAHGEWADVHPSQLLGTALVSQKIDLHTITIDELKAGMSGEGLLELQGNATIDAICAWFDVSFEGSTANPVAKIVELTTAPDATGATHWGQTEFPLVPPLHASAGDSLRLAYTVFRREDYERLLRVSLSLRLEPSASEHPLVKKDFLVD